MKLSIARIGKLNLKSAILVMGSTHLLMAIKFGLIQETKNQSTRLLLIRRRYTPLMRIVLIFDKYANQEAQKAREMARGISKLN